MEWAADLEIKDKADEGAQDDVVKVPHHFAESQ